MVYFELINLKTIIWTKMDSDRFVCFVYCNLSVGKFRS